MTDLEDIDIEKVIALINDPDWCPELNWHSLAHTAHQKSSDRSFQIAFDTYSDWFYDEAIKEFGISGEEDIKTLRNMIIKLVPSIHRCVLGKIKTKVVEILGKDEWVDMNGSSQLCSLYDYWHSNRLVL